MKAVCLGLGYNVGNLKEIQQGRFFYASLAWTEQELAKYPLLMRQVHKMCEGLEDPKVSFWREDLEIGGHFGPNRMHKDGKSLPEEVHRLFAVNGDPTQAGCGAFLGTGRVWQYDGNFLHRGVPATSPCQRLMLRISQTPMLPRNTWCKKL